MIKSKHFLLAVLLPFIFISCKTTNNISSNQNEEPDIISEEENPDRFIYKHVIILGIDGAGAFEAKCNTPNMDRIFSQGIWTAKCISSFPPISSQCWGSMLTGVKPSVHKKTNKNTWKTNPYNNSVYPTIFKLAKETNPSYKLASFGNWTPFYEGLIEQDIGLVTDAGEDDVLTEKISEYIKSEKPNLMFVQLDSVDHAGHSKGWGTKSFYNAMQNVDGYVGQIYEAIKEAGILDDTLFIITADHGGQLKGHGGVLPSEFMICFGAAGKTVNQSSNLKLKGRDLAAIVCYAMNLKTNGNWTSEVPEGFFTE